MSLLKETQKPYLMSKSYAAIVGGAAGVVLVAGLIILWFCKSHFKNFSNKNSETGSSDPYPIALGKVFPGT